MKKRKYLIDPKLMTPFQRGLELHCILEEYSDKLKAKHRIGIRRATKEIKDCTGQLIQECESYFLKYAKYSEKYEVWNFDKLDKLLEEMSEGPYATLKSTADAIEIGELLIEMYDVNADFVASFDESLTEERKKQDHTLAA